MPRPNDEHPGKIALLEHAWRSALANENYYQVRWTGQQRGQMRCFINACPPDRAEEVMLHVLNNWIRFVHCCETDAGAFNTPAKPQVEFLLKHVQIAINCTLEAEAKPATTSSACGSSSFGKKNSLKAYLAALDAKYQP